MLVATYIFTFKYCILYILMKSSLPEIPHIQMDLCVCERFFDSQKSIISHPLSQPFFLILNLNLISISSSFRVQLSSKSSRSCPMSQCKHTCHLVVLRCSSPCCHGQTTHLQERKEGSEWEYEFDRILFFMHAYLICD